MLWPISVVCLAILPSTLGQFPVKCLTVKNIEESHCCPVGKDGTVCNEKSWQGFCVEHLQFDYGDALPSDNVIAKTDNRLYWPRNFFERVCDCANNFAGISCDECAYGFDMEEKEGKKSCEPTKKIRTRRNVLSLNEDERKNLTETIDKAKRTEEPEFVMITDYVDKVREEMKNTNDPAKKEAALERLYKKGSYWDVFTWLHYFTARRTLNDSATGDDCHPRSLDLVNFAHKGAAFPVWHRYYMLHIEDRLRHLNGDPNFSLPYWDWTADHKTQTCSVCTDDLMGAVSQDDEDLRTPSYVWKWDCKKQIIEKRNVSMLSKNSKFRYWNVACGFSEFYPGAKKRDGYNMEGKLCQGPTELDEPLTRLRRQEELMFPSKEEVEKLLEISEYDSIDYNNIKYGNRSRYESKNHFTRNGFRNRLEGFASIKGTIDPELKIQYMHNRVHDWIDGVMGNVPIASNDPIFILHHCNIDRIFEMWMRRHGDKAKYDCEVVKSKNPDMPEGCPIGHDYREFMSPFIPLKRPGDMFKRSTKLGYEYASYEIGVDESSGCESSKSYSPGAIVGIVIVAWHYFF